MKVISLTASPRKNSNSTIAASRAVNFFKEKGYEAEEFNVNKLTIKPCVACNHCKESDRCVVKDDFPALLDKIQEADLFILSGPIYFGRLPGTVKNFIDRCFSLFDGNLKTRLKPGKKCLFITVSHAPQEIFKDETEYLEKWFVDFMKFEKAQKVPIGKCAEPGDITGHLEDLERIDEACKKLL